MTTFILVGMLFVLAALEAEDRRMRYRVAFNRLRMYLGGFESLNELHQLMRLEENGIREDFQDEVRRVFGYAELTWIRLHPTPPQIEAVALVWRRMVDETDVWSRRRLESHLHLLESYALVCKRGEAKAQAMLALQAS